MRHIMRQSDHMGNIWIDSFPDADHKADDDNYFSSYNILDERYRGSRTIESLQKMQSVRAIDWRVSCG